MDKKIRQFALIGAGGGGGGKFNYSGLQIGTGEQMNVWTGTLEEFNQITPDEHTVYFIDGGGYTKRKNYFYFENTSDAPVSVSIDRMGNQTVLTPEFSTDTETWVDYGTTASGVSFSVPAKSKLYVRCKCNGWGLNSTNHNYFIFNNKLNVGGNILSLLYGEDYEDGIKDFPQGVNNYTFNNLFNSTAVEDASNLVIDFNTIPQYALSHTFANCTSLTEAPSIPPVANVYSYDSMFFGCTSLKTSPALPATTLYESSYMSMFQGCTSLENVGSISATTLGRISCLSMFRGCTSLVNAPALPAINVEEGAYWSMFQGCTALKNVPALPIRSVKMNSCNSMFDGCTSLVNAPALPATTMDIQCYMNMFKGCTSLVNAPALPAMELSQNCYGAMFQGCTSLVNAPELPATTMRIGVYTSMFEGCTSLVNAPALPSTNVKDHSYSKMFKGCTSLKKAPALPTKVVQTNSYEQMFQGCTSLESAGAIEANSLGNRSCQNMFNGCTSLKTPPEMGVFSTTIQSMYGMFDGCTALEYAPEFQTTSVGYNTMEYMFRGCTSLKKTPVLYVPAGAEACYNSMFSGNSSLTYIINTNADYAYNRYVNWVRDVAPSGVFVKNASVDWPRGNNGVPNGWIVVNDGDIRGDMMWYKTNDGNIMSPNASKFADAAGNPVSIASNVIDENGIGEIRFTAPVARITGSAFPNKANLTEVWLPYEVMDTGQGTFNDCANLKSIWIWENVDVIGATFNGLTSLKNVYVLSYTPPTLSANQANNLRNYGANIYVPIEVVEDYKLAENWSTIADQIKPM